MKKTLFLILIFATTKSFSQIPTLKSESTASYKPLIYYSDTSFFTKKVLRNDTVEALLVVTDTILDKHILFPTKSEGGLVYWVKGYEVYLFDNDSFWFSNDSPIKPGAKHISYLDDKKLPFKESIIVFGATKR